MFEHATSSVFEPHPIRTTSSDPKELTAPTAVRELLPFTVRVVRNEQELNKAVQIRHSAYARHMPEVAQSLLLPEKADTQDGVVVLLAESKLDGSALGSLRIQTNRLCALGLEKSVVLPDWLQDQSLAQVSRLGIALGTVGRLVKIVLIKASFQYCAQNDIGWAMVAARAPLDRQYAQLMFSDVFPGSGFVPLPHMNNVPHRVMEFEIESGKARWTQAKHPLLKFFCETYHPDIELDDARFVAPHSIAGSSGTWGRATIN